MKPANTAQAEAAVSVAKAVKAEAAARAVRVAKADADEQASPLKARVQDFSPAHAVAGGSVPRRPDGRWPAFSPRYTSASALGMSLFGLRGLNPSTMPATTPGARAAASLREEHTMTALAALKEELRAYTPAAEMESAVLAPVAKIDAELDAMPMALRVAWVAQTVPSPQRTA